MDTVLIYSLIATLGVSLLSFAGLVTLSLKRQWLNGVLFLLISLSAGALLGDVFFHLLPELINEMGLMSVKLSSFILVGIVGFFVLEKFLIWHHHHDIETPEDHESHRHTHERQIGKMNLIGDAFHNFLDGMIIAGSFMISPVAGIGTTVAVLLHEIPQEIGDFGVLIHSGYTVKRALFLNFLTALMAVLGAVITWWFGSVNASYLEILIPITAGGFIYIAGSDLIPELKKEKKTIESFKQLLALLVGILIMYGLLVYHEQDHAHSTHESPSLEQVHDDEHHEEDDHDLAH